jgi:hypothetical protein
VVFVFLKHHHDVRAVKLVEGEVSDYNRARVIGLNPPPRNDYLLHVEQPVPWDGGVRIPIPVRYRGS